MQRYPEPEHSRTQFQIDRIAFFSDAVIAIALTLMFLEIKIPVLGLHTTLQEVVNKYEYQFVLHVIALFMGFYSISTLWMRHHSLFEHIVKYNDQLIKVNLYFLLTVMLLPISTSFLFTDNEPVHLKFLFYFSNLFLCNLAYSLMLHIIFSGKNKFSSLKDEKHIKILKNKSNMVTLIFFVTNVLILFRVNWWYFVFFLFPTFRLLQAAYFKITGKTAPKRHSPRDSLP